MKLKSATITGEMDASFIANKLPIAKLINMARDRGIRHFYSGMSLGTEQVAAEILLDRGYKFTAILPSREINPSWSFRQKQKYQSLLKRTKKKIFLFEDFSENGWHFSQIYMLNRSEILLAYSYEIEKQKTISYATAKNLPILIFHPYTKEFKEISQSWKQLNLW
jgi:uncharacterized phage-like protein YoqJ